jgi:fructose-bisphosphate aldolase class II
MAQVDPRQIVQEAADGGYAVGAFNMHNVETTEALVQAAEQAKAPVFLQIGRAIVPHMGLRKAYEMTRLIAEESDADYVIHLDHGPWDEVFEAIRLGFTSIMYDGAHLPFEENIRTTRKVVEVAHEFGIPVEAELGKIPDADQPVDWNSYYTDVAEAERFVAETGVDFLAISVGIVHGVPSATPQPLDIQRIKEIKAVTEIPLVLHGASGVPEDEVRAATAAGVHKFNADTDLRHAFRSGIEAVWSQGDRQLEEAMAEGRSRMVAATVEKMELYGCAGKAPSLRTLA